MNNVKIIDISGVGVPFEVIVEAVRRSAAYDDVVITARPRPVDCESPVLRLDPHPGGGGSWWIWG